MEYIYFVISPWNDFIQINFEYYHTLYQKNIFIEIIFNKYVTILIYPDTGEIVAYKIKKG